MIRRLHIKNYAIIEELDLLFSDKLTIVTGETGAGKSIMLGGLGLVMGRRADTRALYNANEKCVVEALFDVREYDLHEFFQENDLDEEPELVVRREITPAGKSRAFVNDTPVTLDVLQALSDSLIDLHQQFDTLDIQKPAFKLQVADALAGNHELLKQYKAQYRSYKADIDKLEKLKAESQRALQESDFLQFQLDELNEFAPVAGEQESLEAELETLSNAEGIKRNLAACFRQLTEAEDAVAGQLRTVLQLVSQVKKYSPSLSGLHDRLEQNIYDIEDISSEFERIADDTDLDPERIMEVQNRLNLLYRLLKKHNVAIVDDLLPIQENLSVKLKGFADLSSDILQLEQAILAQETALRGLAARLSVKRHEAIAGFETKVHQLLAQVAMPHAQLKVDIQDGEELLPTGINTLKFLLAPNKGSRFEEIKGIASGGELSRLAFCIKSLVASAIPLPTMVFDEIDAGISGDVSLKMGEIMRQLSNERQVVCITHSPQIAARADRHFFVYKNAEANRTATLLKELKPEERIYEIAKMLSGDPPSESAKLNAKELINS